MPQAGSPLLPQLKHRSRVQVGVPTERAKALIGHVPRAVHARNRACTSRATSTRRAWRQQGDATGWLAAAASAQAERARAADDLRHARTNSTHL